MAKQRDFENRKKFKVLKGETLLEISSYTDAGCPHIRILTNKRDIFIAPISDTRLQVEAFDAEKEDEFDAES